MAFEESRGGHIGRDHALLDDPVRDVARRGLETHDPSVRPDHDPGLGHVEVDGAPLVACAAQRRVRIAQRIEHRRRRPELLAHSCLTSFERPRHLGIGQARPRADHAFEEPRTVHPARPGDDQLATEAEPILVRPQRAQPVRDRFGQHGDDAIGEIDGIPPKPRFVVECRPGIDVGGHVGDRHHDPPPPGGRFAVHRVVEIPRVLPVDGDEPKAAQILSALDVGAAHPRG